MFGFCKRRKVLSKWWLLSLLLHLFAPPFLFSFSLYVEGRGRVDGINIFNESSVPLNRVTASGKSRVPSSLIILIWAPPPRCFVVVVTAEKATHDEVRVSVVNRSTEEMMIAASLTNWFSIYRRKLTDIFIWRQIHFNGFSQNSPSVPTVDWLPCGYPIFKVICAVCLQVGG